MKLLVIVGFYILISAYAHQRQVEETCKKSNKNEQIASTAALGFITHKGKTHWHCSATLITQNYLLTAGSCVKTKHGDPTMVKFHDGKTFNVKNTYRHPEYNSKLRLNIIGLIELEKAVDLTTYAPSCLEINDNLDNLYINVVKKDKYYSVDAEYVSADKCKKTYDNDQYTFHNDSQVCALQKGHVLLRPGFGLFAKSHDYHQLIGIASHGFSHVRNPQVYSNVSYYTPWIESIILKPKTKLH